MEVVDHVMVVVADLERTARRYESEHGLASTAGGRLDGLGAANVIVPLGSEYIELITVADAEEAAASPVGRFLIHRLATVGEGPAAVCLRTTDPRDVGERTKSSPVAMSRTLPSGRQLQWELLGMEGALLEGLPFFITWPLDDDHPARTPVEHPSAASGITWVEVGGDPDRLRAWVSSDDAKLRFVGGAPGVRRFAVATPTGEITFGGAQIAARVSESG